MSETEVEQEPEKVEIPEGFVTKEQNQEEVNKQFRLRKTAETRVQRLETERDEALKKAEEALAKTIDTTIPEIDPFAEDFKDQQAKRDEAIRRAAQQEEQQTLRVAEEKKAQEALDQKQDEDLKAKIAGFDSNTLTHGLNPIEVKQAADAVLALGISETFEDILLEDTDGPLFVKYLATNPVELEQLNAMSALQLVNHLNTDIRPKASLLKPKTSDAPDPPMTLDGGGVEVLQEPWEKGAIYE